MPEGRMPNVLTTDSGSVLSRVGVGTAAFDIGSEATAAATLRRAGERGINWIDTDAAFGAGDAERIIGRAIADLPRADRPFVATTIGADRDRRPRRGALPVAIDPARLQQQLGRSLARLGLEAVDLVKLSFSGGSDALFEDAWSVLLDLKQSGLARAVGLVAPDSARLELAERLGCCDAVHVELSLLDRRVGDSELLWRRAPAPVVIAGRVFAGGRLLAPRDDPSAQRLNDLLTGIAQRRRASPAAVAVAWSLAWPGISAVSIGCRCPEHIDAIADVAAIELSVRDLSDISNHLSAIGGDLGPVHPRRFAKAA